MVFTKIFQESLWMAVFIFRFFFRLFVLVLFLSKINLFFYIFGFKKFHEIFEMEFIRSSDVLVFACKYNYYFNKSPSFSLRNRRIILLLILSKFK